MKFLIAVSLPFKIQVKKFRLDMQDASMSGLCASLALMSTSEKLVMPGKERFIVINGSIGLLPTAQGRRASRCATTQLMIICTA